MAISTDPAVLAAASRCFDDCIPPGDQRAVKTYLLAQIAGVTDPSVLVNAARCFSSCIPPGAQADVQAYLLAVLAGGSTDPSTLMNQTTCFRSCVPPGAAAALANYTLAITAGGSTDPSTLANAARCFSSCIPPGMQMAVQNYLLGVLTGDPDPTHIITRAVTFIGTDPGEPTFPDTMIFVWTTGSGGGSTCPNLTVGGMLLDTQESYADGTALNGLKGGTGWCPNTLYVDRNGYLGLQALDTMEAYSNGVILEALNGGTGFGQFYTSDNPQISIADQQWFVAGTVGIINTVVSSGNPPFTYAWFKNGVLLSDGGNISGSTTASLSISNYQAADNGTYTVSVLDTSSRLATTANCVTAIAVTAGQLWSARVATNGGVCPKAATVSAADTFNTAVAGISAHLFHVNLIAPESLIAALTPFIVSVGATLWTKHIRGVPPTESITINGLQAGTDDTNGTVYDTGFAPSGVVSWSASNGGMSVYVSDATPPSSVNDLSGCYNGVNAAIGIQVNNATAHLFICWDVTQRIQYNLAAVGGFYMASRTTISLLTSYFANSGNAWASTGTNVVNTGRTPNPQNIGVCGEIQAGPVYAPDAGRISFVAYHDGLSSADGQTLFNAAQAFRVAIGGGFV